MQAAAARQQEKRGAVAQGARAEPLAGLQRAAACAAALLVYVGARRTSRSTESDPQTLPPPPLPGAMLALVLQLSWSHLTGLAPPLRRATHVWRRLGHVAFSLAGNPASGQRRLGSAVLRSKRTEHCGLSNLHESRHESERRASPQWEPRTHHEKETRALFFVSSP